MSAEVDSYLAALPPDFRRAAETLRADLKALLPDHIECISYAMPGFRQPGAKGKMVAGYAAFTRHLGLYPHSANNHPPPRLHPFQNPETRRTVPPRLPHAAPAVRPHHPRPPNRT